MTDNPLNIDDPSVIGDPSESHQDVPPVIDHGEEWGRSIATHVLPIIREKVIEVIKEEFVRQNISPNFLRDLFRSRNSYIMNGDEPLFNIQNSQGDIPTPGFLNLSIKRIINLNAEEQTYMLSFYGIVDTSSNPSKTILNELGVSLDDYIFQEQIEVRHKNSTRRPGQPFQPIMNQHAKLPARFNNNSDFSAWSREDLESLCQFHAIPIPHPQESELEEGETTNELQIRQMVSQLKSLHLITQSIEPTRSKSLMGQVTNQRLNAYQCIEKLSHYEPDLIAVITREVHNKMFTQLTRLEQSLADLRNEFIVVNNKLDVSTNKLDVSTNNMNTRLTTMNTEMNTRLTTMNTEMNTRLTTMNTEMNTHFNNLRNEIKNSFQKLDIRDQNLWTDFTDRNNRIVWFPVRGLVPRFPQTLAMLLESSDAIIDSICVSYGIPIQGLDRDHKLIAISQYLGIRYSQ